MFTMRVTFPRAMALGTALIALAAYPRPAKPSDASYDNMPMNYASMMKMEPMAIFHMMDRDKKGYVSRDDFMKFHQAMFDKMDKNKDSRLSEDEFIERTHTGS